MRRGLTRLLVPLGLALLALALATAVVYLFGVIRPRQDPLLMLDLQSNYVAYEVSRAGAATVALRGGWVLRAPDCLDPQPGAPTPLAALLAPAQGARVEYIWGPQTVSLRYSAGAGTGGRFLTVMRDGQRDCGLDGRPFTVILPHAALEAMAPLPILGTGQIGSETIEVALPRDIPPVLLPAGDGAATIAATASAGNYLHGGTVSVYGRASRADEQTVFRVSDADFQIPRGSRVDFGIGATGQDGGAPDVLRGTAILDPEGRGLAVQALTNASDVQVKTSTSVTTFAAGAVVTAVSDPTIAPLLLFVASFIFLFPTLITIYQLVATRE
ncbi:hypothetical protein IT41_13480 [Paracoccus halophilus]|uniref:Uncharacterized protein n=1 Tax=Paracoccus halophilus TaxID=376733 RepID=A0A099EYU3_9RHOB|nr:hypothetical protein IT41_13480 [Paracoccus halophilus]